MPEQLSLVARQELDKLFEDPHSMPQRSTPVSDALKKIGACEKSSSAKDLALLIHGLLTGEKSTAYGSAIHCLW
jgi:hypothetical protein